MKIEHVCPKKKEPVNSLIVGNKTKEFKDWPVVCDGLSGEVISKYKTIIVFCSFCKKEHEYCLSLNPNRS